MENHHIYSNHLAFFKPMWFLVSFAPRAFVKALMDFKNSVAPTGVNIPGKIIDYVVKEARR